MLQQLRIKRSLKNDALRMVIRFFYARNKMNKLEALCVPNDVYASYIVKNSNLVVKDAKTEEMYEIIHPCTLMMNLLGACYGKVTEEGLNELLFNNVFYGRNQQIL